MYSFSIWLKSCKLGKHDCATYHCLPLVGSKMPFDFPHCDVWGLVRARLLYSCYCCIICLWMIILEHLGFISLKIPCLNNDLEFTLKNFIIFGIPWVSLIKLLVFTLYRKIGLQIKKHDQLLDITCTLLLEKAICIT